MRVGDTVYVLHEHTYEPFARSIIQLGPVWGTLNDGWRFHVELGHLEGHRGAVYTEDRLQVAQEWNKLRRSMSWSAPAGVSARELREWSSRILGAACSDRDDQEPRSTDQGSVAPP